MIRRPPRSTQGVSSAASDVYKRQGCVWSGRRAFAFVQNLVTNNVAKLEDGKALYTVMCRPAGGIIDDLLVYRLREDTYILVINASNIEKDFAWMQENNPMGANLHNTSKHIALMALQGPRTFDIAAQITDLPLQDLPYYRFLRPPSPNTCLLYTSPSPRDRTRSRMPSSA